MHEYKGIVAQTKHLLSCVSATRNVGGQTCLTKSDNTFFSLLLLIIGAKKQGENRGEVKSSCLCFVVRS